MTVAAGVMIFVAASLPGPGFTSERETPQPGVKKLLRSLQDPSPETRRQATDTVRTLGSQADPRLVMALATLVRDDPDEKVVTGAVLALAETGGQNRDMAVQALQKSFVRNDISLLCGECYLDAFRQLQALDAMRECVPALLDAAAASDRSTQERAIGKLLD
ncbi:MAG: HEAT repeat domain-containing protein, partial [Thermoanaerobaculia bacterium]